MDQELFLINISIGNFCATVSERYEYLFLFVLTLEHKPFILPIKIQFKYNSHHSFRDLVAKRVSPKSRRFRKKYSTVVHTLN